MFKVLGAKALQFALSYKTVIAKTVIVAAVLGGVYGMGYVQGERHVEKAQIVQVKKDAQAQVAGIQKQEQQLQVKRVEVKVRDIKRERQLTAQLEATRAQRDSLQKVLDAKPDPDPAVYVRLGDVRLLNDAALGSRPAGAGGVSDPSGVSAYQEQAPSTVTLRAFVGTELDVRVQYNELAARHDALVDWVQRELIDPQTAGPKPVD